MAATKPLSVKAQARFEIKKRLEDDMKQVRGAVRMNKYEIKNLVEKQTVLKRRLAETHKLIKMMEGL